MVPHATFLGSKCKSDLGPICKSWIRHCLESPSIKRVHLLHSICDPESGFTRNPNLDLANQISILWCHVCVTQCEMLVSYSLHSTAARIDSGVSAGPCCNSWLHVCQSLTWHNGVYCVCIFLCTTRCTNEKDPNLFLSITSLKNQQLLMQSSLLDFKTRDYFDGTASNWNTSVHSRPLASRLV